jgi:hypothetical protein
MAYHPQSSGKIKRTLKLQWKKLCQETHLLWDELLPTALLRIRSSPTKQIGLSPFKILFWSPTGDLTLRQQIQALHWFSQKSMSESERLPINLTTPIHAYKPGDAVWVKEWKVQLLKPHWRGPFIVILSSPMAVKVAEIVPGIHHSWVKPASLEWEGITDPASPCNSALPQQDSASQEAIGDHRRWEVGPALSLWKLTSLRMVQDWGAAHLTFEDESIGCILLANLGQLSSWGPPGFGLWFMYAYYLSRECCYQNSGFPYLLLLCKHHCWLMHPQPYHLLSVLSWWSVYLF